MRDDSSVILFASNVAASTSRALRFKQFCKKTLQRIGAANIKSRFELIEAYTNLEILDHLRKYGARMVVFHFEGRSDNYRSLLEAYATDPTDSLYNYLGKLKRLSFVFLSGCATDEFVQSLLDSGVPAVITSSHRLSIAEIELFADTVYEQLIANSSLQAAFHIAKEALGVEEGRNQRIFVNLRGAPKARNCKPLKPRIIGQPTTDANQKLKKDKRVKLNNGTSAIQSSTLPTNEVKDTNRQSMPAQSTEAPEGRANNQQSPWSDKSSIKIAPHSALPRDWNRRQPFVGSQPFTSKDGDIFFGREAEIENLLNWVTSPTKPTFILLSGASGIGKSSLIHAGLLPQLEHSFKEYCIYHFSAATESQLFGKLHDKLRKDSGKEDPLDAWMHIECTQKRKILLIVDDIGVPFARPIPGQHEEFPKLLAGLVPIFCDQTYGPRGKVLLCVRDNKLRDVLQQCQHNGFAFEQLPLTRMGIGNLKAAIRKPFLFYSKEQAQVVDAVVDAVTDEIQKDPTSPQLPYLQAIMLRLWKHIQSHYPDSPIITTEMYQELYNDVQLLNEFLDEQLLKVSKRLGSKFSMQQILEILRFHYSAHHQPLPRSAHARMKAFPTISTSDMRRLLMELTESRLLIDSPSDGCGRFQIGHALLAPHINNRLLVEYKRSLKLQRNWKVLGSENPTDTFTAENHPDCAPSDASCHTPIKDETTESTCTQIVKHATLGEDSDAQKIPSNHQSDHTKNMCSTHHKFVSDWKHLSVRLVEIALAISIVLAIVLFGVLLFGLAFDPNPYLNPYVVTLISK